MNIYLASLGCARNQIDSEIMLGGLVNKGYVIVAEPELADLMIVNTCSFIHDAADESIDKILEMGALKSTGQAKYLIVAGCLPERYKENIESELPEVDLFIGTGSYEKIIDAVDELVEKRLESRTIFDDPDGVSPEKSHLRRIPIEDSNVAYIKVAEGCIRHCTYCIIPKLRGGYRSRSIRDINAEAFELVKSGAKELVLVAESTTDYGIDKKTGEKIEDVLKSISANLGDTRIRILYTYPESLTAKAIEVINSTETICSYFDIPIQHASDHILKKMGRVYNQKDLIELFEMIRENNPGAALRTTIITGFPGETEEDFNQLVDFIKLIRFDHIGVFTYSDSEDIASHNLENHVPLEIAMKRQDILMSIQSQISLEKNNEKIGQTFSVLIEDQLEENSFCGRAEFQAPEVDGVIFVYAEGLKIGSFYDVTIVDAFEYDLAGEIS